MADLIEWDFEPPVRSLESLDGLRMMGPEQLGELLRETAVITDDHPYIAFSLWRSLFDPLFQTTLDLQH